jgi:signal recognition particle receptor subunit beta
VIQNRSKSVKNFLKIAPRFEEAKDELMGLLEDDRLRDSPLLVLANKQDLPTAASSAQVTEKLGLYKIRSGRDWFVQVPVSCTSVSAKKVFVGESSTTERSHQPPSPQIRKQI